MTESSTLSITFKNLPVYHLNYIFQLEKVKFALHAILESHKQETNQTIYEIPEVSEEKTIKNRQNTIFTKTAN